MKEEQQIRDVKVRGTVGMRTMVGTLSYHGRACTRDKKQEKKAGHKDD